MKYFILILSSLLTLVFLVTGVKFFIDTWKFKKKAIHTTATVIEIKYALGRNNVKTQSPVLSFTTTKGDKYKYDPDSFFPVTYKLGQEIPVLYPEQQPALVKINSFRALYLPPLLLIVLGLVGIGVSWWLYQKK
ncbi:MAG: DUF3592 domain-containing protein [Chitinophagaceae bacterium]|nr:DUF3592 domain-containing protein [Bacteroidota bacterium]MCC6257495.1 DUF3592 domain-containing protein [Chitinophagaceae bacterium]MCW5916235.1 DUF3592 domain-containing protein [Ferruginibacter sp.]